MRLEDYFEFLAPDDIRVKGTRIGIESVLYEYVYREMAPEAIAQRYPSLTLEMVYATILYYLHERGPVEAYLLAWLGHAQQAREEQVRNPPPAVLRLRALKAQRQPAAAVTR